MVITSNLKKLGLGTAQFGMDYGISNKTGQTEKDEVLAVFKSAIKHGIRTVDTAFGYGNSEAVVGEAIRFQTDFKVVTKTCPLQKSTITQNDIRDLHDKITLSKKRLGITKLYGVLVHDPNDLMVRGADKLFDYIQDMKKSGAVAKIGVSVYNDDQIKYITERFPIDLIQLPLSVFDQRLFRNGALETLSDQGIEIHTRSSFLQGLIFLNEDDVPDRLGAIRPYIKRLREISHDRNISLQAVALSFLFAIPSIQKIIVGVENAKQLSGLILDSQQLPNLADQELKELFVESELLINPRLW